jgi:hypothetical protein
VKIHPPANSQNKKKDVRQAELEIELPGADALRKVSFSIGKCDAQLDDLQQVHVAAQRLVVIV